MAFTDACYRTDIAKTQIEKANLLRKLINEHEKSKLKPNDDAYKARVALINLLTGDLDASTRTGIKNVEGRIKDYPPVDIQTPTITPKPITKIHKR